MSDGVDLSVAVVSYNVRDLLAECLASVEVGGRTLHQEVIVVDNASQDGSATMVRQRFTRATVIENVRNLGFAAATNQALRRSQGRYVLLLNPDSVVTADCLPELVDFMDARPECGAVTCRVWLDGERQWLISNFEAADLLRELVMGNRVVGRLIAGPRRLQPVWRRRWAVWQAPAPCEVDYIQGNFLLVRRSALAQVGELDERFFMYYEDADWSRRLRSAGWKLYFHPGVGVVHHTGQSSRSDPGRLTGALETSQAHYLRKHFTRFSRHLVRLAFYTDRVLARLGGRRQRHRVWGASPGMGGTVDLESGPADLSWTRVSGATRYLVEVSLNPYFLGVAARWVAEPRLELPLHELRKPGFPFVYWRTIAFDDRDAVLPTTRRAG